MVFCKDAVRKRIRQSYFFKCIVLEILISEEIIKGSIRRYPPCRIVPQSSPFSLSSSLP